MIEAQRAINNNQDKDFEKAVNSFQNTFSTDKRLFKSEIAVNYAYSDSLFEAGILTRPEREKIKNGLQTLSKRSEFDKDYFGKHNFKNLSEFIEEKLVQLVGKVGKKITIGRSIQDLSSTVLRFWLRDEIIKISGQIRSLQINFVSLAEKNSETVFFVHNQFQTTHPILFAHWCLAYFELFSRDRERLDEVWRRTNTMPLGSAAGNGTSFEIDREELARKLKFEGISVNSLDAVKDRDFILEFVNALTLFIAHISELIDDILYYSEKARYFDFEDEELKKTLETIRSQAVLLLGLQNSVTTKTFILPKIENFNEYNEIIFKTVDFAEKSLTILTEILSVIRLNKEKSERLAEKQFIDQSEIFEYLIQRGLFFDEAENQSEKIFEYLQDKNLPSNFPIEQLQEISPSVDSDFLQIFNIKNVLRQKHQIGGTSPERVSEAVEEAKNKLKFED